MSVADFFYSTVGVLGFVLGSAIGYLLGYRHGWKKTIEWYEQHFKLAKLTKEAQDLIEKEDETNILD